MAASASLENISDIINELGLMGSNIGKIENEALTSCAQPILEELQNTTDFIDRSGNLRRSFKISKVKKQKGIPAVWIGDIDGNAMYAWPLERGSSRAKAHPFMRPAFERKKDESYRILREKLEEALSK
jgi:HK97 gp10 family phage protein